MCCTRGLGAGIFSFSGSVDLVDMELYRNSGIHNCCVLVQFGWDFSSVWSNDSVLFFLYSSRQLFSFQSMSH
jgi:hypothetical protein